jgi:UDP-N-acetylglucosamine 2-epimerase (non-hydrolysing)
VLVVRDVTERPEAVKAGTLKVIGTERDRIIKEASSLLEDMGIYNYMANAVNPFGDGKASTRIADALLYYFNISPDKPKEFIP